MGAFINAHAIATHSGLDPDVTETLRVGSVVIVLVSSFATAVILVRFIQQVLLSKQILFSFFYFGWRNSIYGKVNQPLIM